MNRLSNIEENHLVSDTFFSIGLAQSRRNIAKCLAFWRDAIVSSLPEQIRQKLITGTEAITVRTGNDRIRMDKIQGNNIQTLGCFDHCNDYVDQALFALIEQHLSKDEQLILIIDNSQMLKKKLSLPATVADNLKQSVYYEMDRHTPFAAQTVLFDTRIERHIGNKIEASLYLLHRSQVIPLLAQFADQGIFFDRLCSDKTTTINLLPRALRRKKPLLTSYRSPLLTIALLALIISAFALPLLLKRHEATQLSRQIAALSPQAEGEIALWNKRDTVADTIDNFIDSYPMPFANIYETLSQRLPDGTWVNRLSYQNGEVKIQGESGNAANLTALINASDIFHGARLTLPITRSRQKTDKENYQIAFSTKTTLNQRQ